MPLFIKPASLMPSFSKEQICQILCISVWLKLLYNARVIITPCIGIIKGSTVSWKTICLCSRILNLSNYWYALPTDFMVVWQRLLRSGILLRLSEAALLQSVIFFSTVKIFWYTINLEKISDYVAAF